jgi:hypothetical protein
VLALLAYVVTADEFGPGEVVAFVGGALAIVAGFLGSLRE